MALNEDFIADGARFEAVDHLSRRLSKALTGVKRAPAEVSAPKTDAPKIDAPKTDEATQAADTRASSMRRMTSQFLNRSQSRRRSWLSALTSSTSPADLTETPMAIASITVVSGPGRGNAFILSRPVTRIGRGRDQDVRLAFGDDYISRKEHAIIFYDDETNGFAVQDGSKPNAIELNGSAVAGIEALKSGDFIRLGNTVVRFTAICDGDFYWQDQDVVPEAAQR
ncbi:MAG: FHA domain-containing protein [Pseudomonadota bacterium]